MKKILLLAILLWIGAGIQASAQTTGPQKPVKTGNEWKMPSDVFIRSKSFADNLQKELGLDSAQTKKVYAVYLANTKPVDEILVQPISEKEKEGQLKANKAAFDKKIKEIVTPVQYIKYLKLRPVK